MTVLELERPRLLVPRRRRLEAPSLELERPRAMYPDGLAGYGAGFGVSLPPLATVRQTAVNKNLISMTFGVPTIVGSLLLYRMTKRQGVAVPPNDGGTWTQLQLGQFKHTTTVNENGIGAWVRLATAATTTYSVPAVNTNSVMDEIVGRTWTLAGITGGILSDQDTLSSVLDLGSAGALYAGQLAFGLFGEGADGVANTVTPGVWVVDYFSDRDVASVSYSISGAGAFPQSFYAHTIGTGATVRARVDISTSQRWGGLYVVSP